MIIDVTRQHEFVATCPVCFMERRLPEGWQDILRASMSPPEALTWDGKMRCLNGHAPTEMVLTEEWHTPVEADGTVIVHLVNDRTRTLAVCTGQPWPGIRGEAVHLPYRLCPACYNLVMHGGYKEP